MKINGKNAIELGFLSDFEPRVGRGVKVNFNDNTGLAAASGRVATKVFTYSEIRSILGSISAAALETEVDPFTHKVTGSELNTLLEAMRLMTSLQLRCDQRNDEMMKSLREAAK